MKKLTREEAYAMAEAHLIEHNYGLTLPDFGIVQYSFFEDIGGIMGVDRDVEPNGLCNDYETRPYLLFQFKEGENGYYIEENEETQEAIKLYRTNLSVDAKKCMVDI